MRVKKEKDVDKTDSISANAALVAEALHGNSMATLSLPPRLREQVRIERDEIRIEVRERMDLYFRIALVAVLIFLVAAIVSFMFIHR
jgi:hypothetical protein